MACWASVMIGYDSAFIGSTIALKSFKDEFRLAQKSKAEFNFLSANVVSCYQAGCFFGALSGYALGHYFGRKWGLFAASLVFIVGSVLQIVASAKTGLGIMYAGRVIAGWSVGVASNLTPIYIAEISPPAIRGRLIGLYELGWQVGAVIGFWIPYGVNQNIGYGNVQWLIPFAIQLVPGGLLGMGAVTLRESPRWLATRRREDRALANDEQHAGPGFLGPVTTLFTSKRYMKRLALCIMLFAMQNFSGINAINYYSPTVFASIGVTGTSTALLTTGVFGLIKFAAAAVWLLWLVDKCGRKPLLIIGSAGGAAAMLWIAIYIAVAEPSKHVSDTLSGGGISAMVAFYLWTCFYGPSWNGTPWVFGAETMPTFIRAATQALIAASNWLFAFLIARFTPQMFDKMRYGVYLFFAVLMLLSIPVVWLVIPETSGIPLEHMDELFVENPRKAHAIVAARLAGGDGSDDRSAAEKADEADGVGEVDSKSSV